jgi:hypothetical protein
VHRHDWLNVEYFLRAIERPGIEIGVALERQADEIGDRVLRLLLQVFVFYRRTGTTGARRLDPAGEAALELIVDAGLDRLNRRGSIPPAGPWPNPT